MAKIVNKTATAGTVMGQLHEEIATIPTLEPIVDPAGSGELLAVFQFVVLVEGGLDFRMYSVPDALDESLIDDKIAAHVPDPNYGAPPFTAQEIMTLNLPAFRLLIAQELGLIA